MCESDAAKTREDFRKSKIRGIFCRARLIQIAYRRQRGRARLFRPDPAQRFAMQA